MNRKFDSRYTISLNVERELYFTFIEGLPRSVSVADEFNQFMKERIDDMEKDKCSETYSVNKSPVKIYENSISETDNANTNSITSTITKCVITNGKNELNIYSSQSELVKHVNRITESKTAWRLKRNAKLLDQLADTKGKNLEK